MITVLTVIGTRPEAVKMAPVLRALARHPDRVRSRVCSTGQHRDLLGPVLDLFAIRPDHALDLMRPGQGLDRLLARMLVGLGRVVAAARPDWVLAQGDTTTVLAAALTAAYRRVRFGHVEAGLRTGDRRRPFPEELNRRLAAVAADLHFAPTERARLALLREGVPDRDILVTGNPVVDAVREVAARPYDWSGGPLAGLPRDRRLVLVTAHRRESFGAGFRRLCRALRHLATAFAREAHFVFPVHPNPRAREPVHRMLAGLPGLSLLEPLDYASMVQLMRRADLVLTDSGGVQEEAPCLSTPVLVLREVTERPEGVEAGLVQLVGTDPDRIIAAAERQLRAPARPEPSGPLPASPYGDGRAGERIAAALLARSAAIADCGLRIAD